MVILPFLALFQFLKHEKMPHEKLVSKYAFCENRAELAGKGNVRVTEILVRESLDLVRQIYSKGNVR